MACLVYYVFNQSREQSWMDVQTQLGYAHTCCFNHALSVRHSYYENTFTLSGMDGEMDGIDEVD